MTAALLREYHRLLSDTRTWRQLVRVSVKFISEHEAEMMPATKPVKNLRRAHAERVQGLGSPALCDAALAQALKETGVLK